jgi:hypothetical protein
MRTEHDSEQPPRKGRRASHQLSPTDVAQAALQHVADLTGREATGVTSIEPAEQGWLVGVEVVEDRRIPASTDILGMYVAEIEQDGTLLAYRRTRRYPRGHGDDGGAA